MTAEARAHHFWDCVVAEALRDVLREHANVGIARNQLWLVQAPPGLLQVVRDTVCLADVAALDYGRQRLYTCCDASDRTAEVAVVRRFGVKVIADSWSRLAAFVSLRWPLYRWDLVPNQHPFRKMMLCHVILPVMSASATCRGRILFLG